MGNCGSSINCTAVNQPVEGNPEVAGIGVRYDQVELEALVFRRSNSQVLMSFGATAVLTFITLVVGYLSDSLPDTSLSQLDRACIIKLSTINWRPWVRDGPIRVLLQRSMTLAVGVLGWDFAVTGYDKGLEDNDKSRDARKHRSKGLERFILALSDQQLVTGLAILIAGFVSPCSMSIYHFKIIAALAWFSSTTHLSTLAVLRVYLIDHSRLRDWRVVAMLVVLGLLVISQVGTVASMLDDYLPIRCAFIHSPSGLVRGPNVASMTLVIIFLGATCTHRIVRLYSLDLEWSLQAWLVDGVLMAFNRTRRLKEKRQKYLGTEIVKVVINSSNNTKAEKSALWRRWKERRRYIRHYDRLKSTRSGRVRRFHLALIMMSEINHSFLGDLLTLEFGVAFGITQVIISRKEEPSAGIVGSQNDLTFGQLVPLLLMLLPLFAALEAYFGNTNNPYAWGSILIALTLERRDDILTKPSNDRLESPDLTHGKPFSFPEIGMVDLFRACHSTQPIPDNDSGTLNASSLLQLCQSVLCLRSVLGSTSIELPDLPAGRLRRPDTETGQRAPTRVHGELAMIPSRSPEPESRVQLALSPKKPPRLWNEFTFLVLYITVFQTMLAYILGGLGGFQSLFSEVILGIYFFVAIGNIVHSIYLGLKGSGNP